MAPTVGGTAPARIKRSYADGRFGQIHYRVAGAHGTQSPLLMLHPSPLSGYVFENLMTEMGREKIPVERWPPSVFSGRQKDLYSNDEPVVVLAVTLLATDQPATIPTDEHGMPL